MKYAKFINETTIDRNPPRRATINGREVRGELPADYLATLDYFPFESAPFPTEDAPEGKHWEERYTQGEGTVTSAWVAVDNPPPSVAPYDSAMESHLRSEREARGYTTREPDVYLNSQVPRWAQDARDWIAHRDAVMLYALDIINAVQSGEREPPTMEEFIEGLPTIEWTDTDTTDTVESEVG